MRDGLVRGHSVCVDNTHPDLEIRGKYVAIAKEMNAPVVCIKVGTCRLLSPSLSCDHTLSPSSPLYVSCSFPHTISLFILFDSLSTRHPHSLPLNRSSSSQWTVTVVERLFLSVPLNGLWSVLWSHRYGLFSLRTLPLLSLTGSRSLTLFSLSLSPQLTEGYESIHTHKIVEQKYP